MYFSFDSLHAPCSGFRKSAFTFGYTAEEKRHVVVSRCSFPPTPPRSVTNSLLGAKIFERVSGACYDVWCKSTMASRRRWIPSWLSSGGRKGSMFVSAWFDILTAIGSTGHSCWRSKLIAVFSRDCCLTTVGKIFETKIPFRSLLPRIPFSALR